MWTLGRGIECFLEVYSLGTPICLYGFLVTGTLAIPLLQKLALLLLLLPLPFSFHFLFFFSSLCRSEDNCSRHITFTVFSSDPSCHCHVV